MPRLARRDCSSCTDSKALCARTTPAGCSSEAQRRGWAADLLIFRSCGDEPNRALRFYHSGETTDLDSVVRRLIAADPAAPLLLVGVSLGGNVLLKWLGEQGDRVPDQVRGAAAISVPFDLARGSRFLDSGFSRFYQAHFLRSLRKKALAKSAQYPARDPPGGRASARARSTSSTIWSPRPCTAFAMPMTTTRGRAPCTSSRACARATLLLSARDDPFLPRAVLDEVRDIARHESVAASRVRRAWRTCRLHRRARCRGARSTTRNGARRSFSTARSRCTGPTRRKLQHAEMRNGRPSISAGRSVLRSSIDSRAPCVSATGGAHHRH